MKPTLFHPVVRRVTTRLLVPAAALIIAGCQAASSGRGGGRNATDPDDVAAGEATYNQVCAQCHGTPGRNDGTAPDLTGATAALLEAEVTNEDHGGGRIDGFLDRHYLELAAYLAGDENTDDGGDDDTGDDDGGRDDDDGEDNGDDDGGWDDGDDDGGWDDGADVTTACDFATAAEIASLRQSVQGDYWMGYSRDEELSMMAQGCQLNSSVPYDECMACGAAIVDEIYP